MYQWVEYQESKWVFWSPWQQLGQGEVHSVFLVPVQMRREHTYSQWHFQFHCLTDFRDYQENGETKTETTYSYREPSTSQPLWFWFDICYIFLYYFSVNHCDCFLVSRHRVEIWVGQQSKLWQRNRPPEPEVNEELSYILCCFKLLLCFFLAFMFMSFLNISVIIVQWQLRVWRSRLLQWKSGRSSFPKVTEY